jgi:hypothetical protein
VAIAKAEYHSGMPRWSQWVLFVLSTISAAGAIVKILEYFNIKPAEGQPLSALLWGLTFLLVSIATSAWGFYCLRKTGIELKIKDRQLKEAAASVRKVSDLERQVDELKHHAEEALERETLRQRPNSDIAPSWLNVLGDGDDAQMQGRISYLVGEMKAEPHLNLSEPYINLSFRLVNLSIFNITLDGLEGKLTFPTAAAGGEPLTQQPEIYNASAFELLHGSMGMLYLRQHITAETARAMRARGEVTLGTAGFKLRFTYVNHRGERKDVFREFSDDLFRARILPTVREVPEIGLHHSVIDNADFITLNNRGPGDVKNLWLGALLLTEPRPLNIDGTDVARIPFLQADQSIEQPVLVRGRDGNLTRLSTFMQPALAGYRASVVANYEDSLGRSLSCDFGIIQSSGTISLNRERVRLRDSIIPLEP